MAARPHRSQPEIRGKDFRGNFDRWEVVPV